MSPAVKLPNGDEGNFRIVTYESELGNGEEFYEYLVLEANNERWLVKDHFFNPRQLR